MSMTASHLTVHLRIGKIHRLQGVSCVVRRHNAFRCCPTVVFHVACSEQAGAFAKTLQSCGRHLYVTWTHEYRHENSAVLQGARAAPSRRRSAWRSSWATSASRTRASTVITSSPSAPRTCPPASAPSRSPSSRQSLLWRAPFCASGVATCPQVWSLDTLSRETLPRGKKGPAPWDACPLAMRYSHCCPLNRACCGALLPAQVVWPPLFRYGPLRPPFAQARECSL